MSPCRGSRESMETYEYRICGYQTSPHSLGSLSDPLCFDSDRGLRPTTRLSPGDHARQPASRLHRDHGPQRPQPADRGALLTGRPRLRRREERPDQGVRRPLGHHPRRSLADLRNRVHDFWDRGLLGLALIPAFPANASIYALYTHDAPDRRHGAGLQRRLRRPERQRMRGQRAALGASGWAAPSKC